MIKGIAQPDSFVGGVDVGRGFSVAKNRYEYRYETRVK